MKTGNILLVHSNTKQSKIIQKFQKREDEEAGFYNHSGIIYEGKGGFYVVEESYIKGRKIKAAAVFTPMNKYLKGNYELMLLKYKGDIDEGEFEKILFDYVGIPYDYNNLLRLQVVRLIHGWWLGTKKKKAWKKMVCHEFTQKIWNDYKGFFPEYYKADVSKIYRNINFEHEKIK